MAPPSARIVSLLSLEKCSVLITGASSGIGAHLTEVFHEAGANVVMCARRTERLQELADRLHRKRQDAGAYVVAMDVADPSQVAHAFVEAERCLGGAVEIVVNCAGIAKPNRAVDVHDADYDELMSVNQRGAFTVAREAARRMLRASVKGSIINIASIHGLRQGSSQVTYAMSKSAVIQMTKVMALEMARQGVRVNAIAPGYFPTEMNEEFLKSEAGQKLIVARIPMQRLGNLSELDAAVLLLASGNASSFITGVCLPVDGGHVMSAL
eukprot:TRINITY_DN21740_c0_g2_i1.p1 TRINITY_DN21740_c0_g2~~TRINITY_DN21740_c0_g2_i1.p1  ORF type:complete len:268 (-),score=54.60 TRINITY_DN21740_c0_g2_i1:60-863(-)